MGIRTPPGKLNRAVHIVDIEGNPSTPTVEATNVTFGGSATTQDMGASWNSDSIDVSYISGFSLDGDWEGAATPVGTLKLQARNDDGQIWKDITGSSHSINGADGVLWNLSDQQYRYVRIVYTRTSGGSGDDFNAVMYSKR